jgi:hypothetical protein
MRIILEQFEAGEVYIATLISDLEGLLAALELASEDWIDSFRTKWGGLEIAYAVALDELGSIPDNTDPAVRASVNALLAPVHERLWVLT